MGRATQGVKLINLEKKNDEIASVCKVDTEPEVEETSEQIELNVENQTEEIVENEETINENNEENNEIGDDNDDSKGSAQGTLNFED
jgi:DNA gyrase subunit A